MREAGVNRVTPANMVRKVFRLVGGREVLRSGVSPVRWIDELGQVGQNLPPSIGLFSLVQAA